MSKRCEGMGRHSPLARTPSNGMPSAVSLWWQARAYRPRRPPRTPTASDPPDKKTPPGGRRCTRRCRCLSPATQPCRDDGVHSSPHRGCFYTPPRILARRACDPTMEQPRCNVPQYLARLSPAGRPALQGYSAPRCLNTMPRGEMSTLNSKQSGGSRHSVRQGGRNYSCGCDSQTVVSG